VAVRRSGFALVVTLAAIVFLTVLILAFFSTTRLSRQIGSARAARYQADALMDTAIDVIVSDLRQEISLGSKSGGIEKDGIYVYLPKSPVDARPTRAGDAGMTNVIKRSAADVAFYPDGPKRAISSGTANPGRNRGGISAARWNAPRLLATNPTSTPDWCPILRGGPIDTTVDAVPSLAAMADPAAGGSGYLMGRYAFMVYDEGALLNISVAANSPGPPGNLRRGRLYQAELAALAEIPDQDALRKWRNPSPDANWLAKPENDFLKVRRDLQPNEQTFLRRQDLLRFVERHPTVITPAALPYLGTFSRQLNAPSWSPPANAVDLGAGGNNGSGNLYAYKDNADNADAINRNLANARATQAFTRRDGSQAAPGEPLVNRRFPLDRLGLVTNKAIAASGSDIEHYFGLTRDDALAPWVYRGNAGAIQLLGQVAGLARDADAAELLKAVILSGSLGKSAEANVHLASKNHDINADHQVIQILANLIDQYDADSLPTTIRFNGREFYGVENLPYIDQIYHHPFRPYHGDPAYPDMEGRYEFGLWNPHQNAASAPSAEFRVLGVAGASVLVIFEGNWGASTSSLPVTHAGQYLEFTASGADFQEPRLLTPPDAPGGVRVTAWSPAENVYSQATTPKGPLYFAGLFAGRVQNRPDKRVTGNSAHKAYFWAEINEQASGGRFPTFHLQIKDAEGNWRTYQEISDMTGHASNSVADTSSNGFTQNFNKAKGVQYGLTCVHSFDPRTKRYGMPLQVSGVVANQTIRSGTTLGVSSHNDQSRHPWGPLWKINNTFGLKTASIRSALLAENTDGTTLVRDYDGIVRRGDGDAGNGIYPLAETVVTETGQLGPDLGFKPNPNAVAARPIVLDRPFASVAEMGYAMRGEPWKSLNFFSADSADAGLLDAFTLDDAPLVAGRVNLNTPHAAVLEAVLRGALKAEGAAATALDQDEAEALAALLVEQSGNQPLTNPGELVTRLGDLLAAKMTVTAEKDAYIKTRREALARALGGVGDTRTWNLFIDVVAQAGRYPRNARNLDDFVVAGQRRCWVHVAIDRYTGRVIDQQVEEYYE
jgi:hypothetical protein